MQIELVEATKLKQLFEVFQPHGVAGKFNQPFRPETLDHSIYVHRTDAEGFGKFILSYREGEFVIRGQSYRCEPSAQLGEQMSQPSRSFPRAEIDYPFSKDRCIDNSFTPQSAGKLRPVFNQAIYVTMLDKRNCG